MRPIYFLFAVAVVLFSCNNSGGDKQAGDADSSQAGPAPGGAGSKTVVDAVNDLKSVLESKDKNSIANLFQYPLADTVLPVYIDDSVFKKNYTSAGDKLTRSMFISYYDAISKDTYLDKITEIFKYLSVDSLQYNNTLHIEFTKAGEDCNQYYEIANNDGVVTLTYGLNGHQPDSKASAEEQEIGCEFASFWIFRFEGGKLHFVRQASAG